ncbi:hypothetical protein CPB84DRAFT_1957197 [Gymnopilus junonius]|uniref:Pentatricopeptide repeat-containing protein n=1 Tax=Gymnopilus junonius TaxID=109634 RepID=A0A9P5P1H0_GYMJU|nr:hypothetical protein CPB84DRAFT_1957197 [Gymnopilus junonius]
MLQRSFFAQKRHLESIILTCKHLACRPVFSSGRRPSSTRHARAVVPSTSSASSRDRVECVENVPKYPHSQSSAPELERVINALASNLAQEKILQFIKDFHPLFAFFSDRKRLRETVKELAQSQTPHYSLQVLDLAYKLGCTLNASAYESVSFHLAKSSNWDIMLGVVASASNHIGHTTLRLLNWRALALLESQRFSLLRRIPEEFQAAGISPTRRTYHIILSGCLRNDDLESAKACLRDMKAAGFQMDATTHSLISNLYRRYGADSQVRQNALDSLFDLNPEARISVVNRLIQSSLDTDDLSSTARLLMLFDTESISNIVPIIVSSRAATTESSVSFELPQLSGSFLKPDSNTCAIFMNYLIRKVAFDEAIALGKDMNSSGNFISPNLVASFMHAYFLRGQGNTAVRIALKLSAPQAIEAFESLMEGFDEGETPHLDVSRISLTTRICNVLLRGILNRQGLGFVPAIFSVMHSNNIRPNARTLEILLSYMNKINVPRPRTLFQVLRKLSPSNISPSLKHMHPVVARIFVTKRTCSFPSRGVMSDSVMVFLRIRRHSVLHMDVESAHRVLRTLMARGMHPNEYHFGALVEGYALSGNFAAYARRRDSESAMRTFKEMVAADIAPDVASVDALVSSFYTAGSHEAARKLLMTLWSYVQPFPEALKTADLPEMLYHFRALSPSVATRLRSTTARRKTITIKSGRY